MAIGGIGKPGKPGGTMNLRPKAEVIHTIRGKIWAEAAGVPLDNKTLQALGRCMVANLKRESAKYLTRIGWSGNDPMGGPPLPESFSFRLKDMDVQIRSTFYGMKELAHGAIPSRRMTWLTQEAKKKSPDKYPLTPREKALGKSQADRDGRLPLIVPIKSGGSVEFRSAPIKMSNAWVHPGIAKFTFFETAIRKGRKACVEIVKKKIQKDENA